jgi:lysozyme
VTPTQKRAAALALATSIAMPAEGLRQWAYRDPVGIPTICFGTTTGVKLGDYRTLEQCKQYLNADMAASVATVERCAKPTLTVNQTAAFADAVYNLGPTLVCSPEKSTLARKLSAGDVPGACRELPRWSRATIAGVSVELPGLVKRRQKEMALCLDGSYVQPPFLTNTPLGVVNAS